MDINSIYSIFLNIAKSHDADHNKRINQFAVLFDQSDINKENYGRTQEDITSGEFWMRSSDWYGSTMIIAKPFETIKGKERCFNVMVGVTHPITCEKCFQTRKQAEDHCTNVLRAVIERFKDTKIFKNSDDTIYSHKKQIDGFYARVTIGQKYLNDTDFEIKYNTKGQNELIASTTFTICACNEITENFTNDYDEKNISAHTECSSC